MAQIPSDYDQVVRDVNDRVDGAIRENQRRERIIVCVLIILFLAGIGLTIYGAIIRHWEILAPGAVMQCMVIFPVRRLIRLREDNIRLQILPQLLRLADEGRAKTLAARLVQRLIDQVKQ